VTLVEKVRQARERQVDAGGWKFTIRRPRDDEAIDMQGKAPLEFVRRFVVGWNVPEHEVVPGGGGEVAQFVPEVWHEWVGDRPELWMEIALGVMNAYAEHVKAREEREKK
jgi:hypothetical protein